MLAVLTSQAYVRFHDEYQPGRMAWITGVVEDVLLAYWIKEITETSEGMLSPDSVMVLAYIVNQSLYGPRSSTTH